MQFRALLGCAACVWIAGCTVGSMEPAVEDAPGAEPHNAEGDTGGFAPAADPDDASTVDSSSPPSEPSDPPPPEEPADSSVAADTATAEDSSMPATDSGAKDTGTSDTGTKDTATKDTGTKDTGIKDTGSAPPDTGAADTATAPDTKVADSSTPDTAATDTGSSTDTGAPFTDAGSTLVWRTANLTNFTSYPDPGSEECIKYSGCEWAGQFAALSSKMPESWVSANNIAAVHSKDFAKYKLKTLRLRQGTKQIDVKVYDECADSDCSGCCTANSKSTGFLIDIESYTAARFGTSDGIVEWVCLDC